jgi:hypothetical protein
MFLVRSAFWLTVAFIALHPQNVDLGAEATRLSDRAVAAGQQFVTAQLLNQACLAKGCAALGLAAAQTAPPAASPAEAPPRTTVAEIIRTSSTAPGAADVSTTGRPPFPRPRPAWLG